MHDWIVDNLARLFTSMGVNAANDLTEFDIYVRNFYLAEDVVVVAFIAFALVTVAITAWTIIDGYKKSLES